MNVLIVNCGSSSQNFKIYQAGETGTSQIILSGKARNVATATKGGGCIDWQVKGIKYRRDVNLPSHADAARECLNIFTEAEVRVDVIGHRFVHGGEWLTDTTEVNDSSLDLLRKCLPLAPIHNPNSLSVVMVYKDEMPGVPQYLVFDTQFHAHIPDAARQYALPRDLVEHFGFKKYGFHGLSYQYVSAKAAELLDLPLKKAKLVMCHLGTGGSSVAAYQFGHTVDTSMGYSPLAGLVMSTRSGDLDPEVVLELNRQGYSIEEVSQLLNHQSGLLGLSGYSSNLLEIIEAAEAGDARCALAFDVYAHRLRHYIGAYYWQMGGADAIVFTDDIGTQCWQLRERVFTGVEGMGILLDEKVNRDARPDLPQFLQPETSKVKILSIPTDEERVILEEVLRQFHPV